MNKNNMSRHHSAWYIPGKVIQVHDKMQKNYSYVLSEHPGANFAPEFTPELTPSQMLALGVFEGKYLCDCQEEFPIEWFMQAKLSPIKPNPSLNLFKIKSRLSLQEWQKRSWIPCAIGDQDVRGWFQWYCRYWLGRREPLVDQVQIKRWRAFTRHRGQIIHSLKRIDPRMRPHTHEQLMKHRPRQRQALLQWAYDPFTCLP